MVKGKKKEFLSVVHIIFFITIPLYFLLLLLLFSIFPGLRRDEMAEGRI